ncbi:MAG: Signal peptide peptidase SppA (protease 4) [Rhodanobacteraceae bacterium]|jgi:protease-4|nr:MAG: Signal peptide peptidase SppA (protease 4) [Rhodanobacteraceae bacterium]
MTHPSGSGFAGFVRALGRGINIARLVIINVVFFGILFLILGLAMRGAPQVASNTVLLLKPTGMLVEQYSIDPAQRALARMSGQPVGQVQVRDLVAAIDHAARDPRITRILIDPSDMQFGGMGALEDVGAALDRFRAAGKPVTAWGTNLGQMQYLLAAHANEVLLDPAGSISISGLSDYRSYFKTLLDKLGVSAHLFRVGTFKSAAEPFILDAPSQASLDADKYWMGGLWNTWLDEVGKLRHIDPAALGQQVDSLPTEIPSAQGDVAQLALKLHWVDGLATREDVVKMMQRHGVVTDNGTGFRAVDLSQYLPQTIDLGIGKPEVAVIVAEGDIVSGRQPAGRIGGESTAALIRAARANHNVRAIVLRVDSPGGEAFAAEQIRREVVLARQAGKPVIVSMGDMAASGGYWIAMDADRIFAEPDTITGSIGIFGLYFTASDGLAKLGINTAGEGTTPLAGAFDFRRPLDPALGAMIQSSVDKGYRDFVGNVAKARGKSFADIDAIAQGRVWSGEQALQRGLVDQMGGLQDAIDFAARDAKLGGNYAVRYFEPPTSAFQRFFMDFGNSATARMLTRLGLRVPQSWLEAVPRLAPELQLLEHVQPGKPITYAYCFCRLQP